jgi:transcriptional regulator with XRE-family HTH domain
METNRLASRSRISELIQSLSPLRKKQLDARLALADIIEKAVDSRKISKLEFARRMGKQPSVISKWLSGTHNFTIDTIVEIEEDLHLNILKRKYEDTIRDSMVSQTTLTWVDPVSARRFQDAVISKQSLSRFQFNIKTDGGQVSLNSTPALWHK